MKLNRGIMDLQLWMTRSQITGNRLTESRMDLLLDVEITSPEALAHVAQRRQVDEQGQQKLEGSAAATPGAESTHQRALAR